MPWAHRPHGVSALIPLCDEVAVALVVVWRGRAWASAARLCHARSHAPACRSAWYRSPPDLAELWSAPWEHQLGSIAATANLLHHQRAWFGQQVQWPDGPESLVVQPVKQPVYGPESAAYSRWLLLACTSSGLAPSSGPLCTLTSTLCECPPLSSSNWYSRDSLRSRRDRSRILHRAIGEIAEVPCGVADQVRRKAHRLAVAP